MIRRINSFWELGKEHIPLLILFVSLSACFAVSAIVELLRGDWGALAGIIFYVIFFGALFSSVVIAIRDRRNVAQLYDGHPVLYAETCGGRLGLIRYSWPAIRVIVYEGVLVIKPFDKFELLPKDIWRIKLGAGLTRTGALIQHTRGDLMGPLLLWSWNPDKLKSKIEEGLHLNEMPQYGKDADGCSHRVLRRRLIEGNAPQRKKTSMPWRTPYIYRILKNPVYYTGVQAMIWTGQVHEIHYPIIIDEETARRVAERKANAKAFPARHVKHNYLGLGLVYCAACNLRMASRTARTWRSKGKPRNYIAREYRCANYTFGYPSANCARVISVKELDAKLWEKVATVLDNNDELEDRVRTRVEELRHEESDAEASIERIKRQLTKLDEERQWVITQARKRSITQADMDRQLGELNLQVAELRAEVNDKSLLVGNRAERLLSFAIKYRASMRGKLKWLCSTPESEDKKLEQFQARREMVEMIVKRVNVQSDKDIKVEFEFDLTGMDQIQESPSKSQ